MTAQSNRVTNVLCSAFCLASVALGCSRGADSNQDTTQPTQSAPLPSADAPIILRGTVASISGNQLVLTSDTETVKVTMTQPFHLYSRVPGDISRVSDNSFVGVTSVKQADGSELATKINIFPEELRGLGEGSRMMAPDTSAAASRMTNGNVSASRMTNGTASQSRMSNGSVSGTNGSSLIVNYAGGSQTVTVSPTVIVTEMKVSSAPLAKGDRVALVVKKAADGSLTSDKAISTGR
jgi:hypothetical protein